MLHIPREHEIHHPRQHRHRHVKENLKELRHAGVFTFSRRACAR
jgi:hypothetical protein